MIIFAGLFGLIVGSFLNALLFRWGTGAKVWHGRSRCMRCGHVLGALDLVPVFSFLFLRGRCRYCRAAISWQYPAVEALAALLFVGVYALNPAPAPFIFWSVVWMALLFVAVYDLRHQIILPSFSLFLAALALVYVWTLGFGVWNFAAGFLLAAPLFLLSLVSRGRWMGWADSGLELSLGWLLGLTAGLTALMLAFWTGAAVGIALLSLSKKVTIGSEVPFAPFLILGTAIAYFFHVDFFFTLPLLFSF